MQQPRSPNQINSQPKKFMKNSMKKFLCFLKNPNFCDYLKEVIAQPTRSYRENTTS